MNSWVRRVWDKKKLRLTLLVLLGAGMLAGCVFGYRAYKRKLVEDRTLETIKWIESSILEPNKGKIGITDCFGGDVNWLGLGKVTGGMNFITVNGSELTLFLDIDSSVIGTDVVRMELTYFTSTPNSASQWATALSGKDDPHVYLLLDEFQKMPSEQRMKMFKSAKAFQVIHVTIPPEKLKQPTAIYLDKIFPPAFEPRIKKKTTAPSSTSAP